MRDYLDAQLRAVLDAMDGVPDEFEPELEKPAQPEHGDLATNTAMRLAGALKNNPRAIADDLAARLREQVDPARIEAIEVAGRDGARRVRERQSDGAAHRGPRPERRAG